MEKIILLLYVLQPSALEKDVNSLCNLSYLPAKGFPLIFHSVLGKDKREKKSPSHCNPLEVVQVVDYVKKLLQSCHPQDMGIRIDPSDIGIISPYRLQVCKVRTIKI